MRWSMSKRRLRWCVGCRSTARDGLGSAAPRAALTPPRPCPEAAQSCQPQPRYPQLPLLLKALVPDKFCTSVLKALPSKTLPLLLSVPPANTMMLPLTPLLPDQLEAPAKVSTRPPVKPLR